MEKISKFIQIILNCTIAQNILYFHTDYFVFSFNNFSVCISFLFKSQISLPVETVQSRSQSARHQRFSLFGTVAWFLREKPKIRYSRNKWTSMQRHIDRCGWMWFNVLRTRVSNAGGHRCRAMLMHFPLVLRSQM